MSKPKNMTPAEELAYFERRSKINKKYADKNREKLREKSRRHREKEMLEKPDHVRERKKAWYHKNAERERKRGYEWRLKNPDKCKAAYRKWKTENPEKVKQSIKDWRDKNKDHISHYASKRLSELPDSVVANSMKLTLKAAKSFPLLIEAKREQLKIIRELKPTNRTKQNAQESKQPATSPR